jgi:AGCS family alanine or glycine:cation symporter
VTAVLAPAMALMYVTGALIILAINARSIPHGVALVFSQAFSPEPLIGGGVGSFLITMLWGIRRGLFSNEAGQGSAPIAHATARTDEPVREGLVASLEPFIDTLVICTMTGLVIVTTGAFLEREEQPLPLASVEAVLAPAAPDERIDELRESREASAGGQLRVASGRPVDGTLVFLDATVEKPRFLDDAGQPWSGLLRVAGDGSLSLADGAALPSLRGEALLTGAPLTAAAFRHGLGGFGNLIVTIAVVLFAVSTGISWSYYGDRATEFLVGSWAIPIYRWVFIFFFFMGGVLPLTAVWTYGDVALGLMTFPNLIAVILLSGAVARMTREYFSREQVRNR